MRRIGLRALPVLLLCLLLFACAAAGAEEALSLTYAGEPLPPEGLVIPVDTSKARVVTAVYDPAQVAGVPEWTSTDANIAAANKDESPANRRIVGRRQGRVEITCTVTLRDGSRVEKTFPVTVYTQAEKMTLSAQPMTIEKGGRTEPLGAQVTVQPDNFEGWKWQVSWSSSDERVATVDGEGRVTGVAGGTATITGVLLQPNLDRARVKPVSVQVTVNERINSIELSPEKADVPLNGKLTLTAAILPGTASNKRLAWSTSDPAVATVSEGVVTGLSLGECVITAQAQDGSGATAQCALRVIQPVESIRFENAFRTLYAGDSAYANEPVVEPENHTVKELVWSSSDPAVAQADPATGAVMPLSRGRATITAKATDGSGVSGSYTVVVDPACPVEITGFTTCYAWHGDSNCLFITPRNDSCERTVTAFGFRVDCYDGNDALLCSYDCAWEGEGFPAIAPGQEGDAGPWHWKDLYCCVYAQRVEIYATRVSFDSGETWERPAPDGEDAAVAP